MHIDDLHFNHREYNKWQAYGQSKTADVLLAVKAAKELGKKGVTALAVHLGFIMTQLMRYMSPTELEAQKAATIEFAGEKFFMKTISQGAATSAWAATAPELKGKGPLYLEDCRVAQPIEEPNLLRGILPYALDEELAERLWRKTEEELNRPLPL